MTNDELEFLISQHLDGTLDAAEEAKVRHALETRADARALLASYQKLDQVLKATARPVEIDPEWLTAQIAARIDEAPVRTFELWEYTRGPLMAAAALAVGLTIGIVALRNPSTPDAPTDIAAIPSIDLSVPMDPAAPGSGVTMMSVSIGVPADLSPAKLSALYLADNAPVGRVSIRPAGQPERDVFE